MDKFEASNGYTISAGTHGIFIRDRGGFIIHDLGKYSAEAVREFIQAERERKPWDDAERGDVWLFRSTGNGRALAWRAADTWDAIDPRGNFHSSVEDVPAEMRAHGFWGWEDPTAQRIYALGDGAPDAD